MKAINFLISIFLIACLIPVNAQSGKEVPANVKAEFSKLYPTVKDAKWHKEEGNYEAKFKFETKEMSVQINGMGHLVQKEVYLKMTDLPKSAQEYLSKKYAGVKIDEVSEVTDSKNIKHYQVETKTKVVFFDTKGTFMKEEKNDEKDDDD